MKSRLALLVSTLLLPATVAANPALVVKVHPLTFQPTVDGNLEEWQAVEPANWHAIEVLPALKNDSVNETNQLGVKLVAGVFQDTFYLAAHWPDPTRSVEYKVWKWSEAKQEYMRGRERDDMFVIRFHMSGSYDTCMLTDKTYRVDVWRWSSGRSNLAGLAEDMTHLISPKPMEGAAEYGSPEAMVYIKKEPDAGTEFYRNTKPPKQLSTPSINGVEVTGSGSDSLVDVVAKGEWRDGYWNIEFSRKLNTTHPDDMVFTPGAMVNGGIAVFNKGYAEHKSVNGDLLFDFSQIK